MGMLVIKIAQHVIVHSRRTYYLNYIILDTTCIFPELICQAFSILTFGDTKHSTDHMSSERFNRHMLTLDMIYIKEIQSEQ